MTKHYYQGKYTYQFIECPHCKARNYFYPYPPNKTKVIEECQNCSKEYQIEIPTTKNDFEINYYNRAAPIIKATCRQRFIPTEIKI